MDEEAAPTLPSREAALAACREAIGSGPVLITGAAGVGKTWIVHLLAEDSPLLWLFVDAAPGMTQGDLLRSMIAALGMPVVPGPTGSARIALSEALAQVSADGRTAGLIFDEAHLAGDDVLEEVRLLANRLGRPDGLAAIVVSGQTPLARRIDTRPLAGFESRLAARVHLLPLDVDEAATWLGARAPAIARDFERVELLHRETGGNPSRLNRLAAQVEHPPARIHRNPPPRVEIAPPPVIERQAPVTIARPADPIVPAKPPLRVEDGLIEVGWDAEAETETHGDDARPRASRAEASDAEQPIDDHYAALQAWDEWTRNQGRAEIRTSSRPDLLVDESAALDQDDEVGEEASPLDSTPGLWAEGRHSFGPYSQLFSRLKAAEKAE